MEEKIKECQEDLVNYEQWGKLLHGHSVLWFFNINSPIDELTLHNGLEYGKASMKLNVLLDNTHSKKEKEERIRQVDSDIQLLEEIIRHDFDYRRLLIKSGCFQNGNDSIQ